MAWTWLAAPALVAGFVAVAMAVLVYALAPRRDQSRWLSVFLYSVGINTAFGIYGLTKTVETNAMFSGLSMVMVVSAAFFTAAYLSFLGTLPSPLAAPLRPKPVVGAIWLFWLTASVLLVLPTGIPMEHYAFVDGRWVFQPAGQLMVFQAFITLMHLYALAIAATAYRRATTPLSRRKMRAYLIAFGVYDAVLVGYTIFTQTPIWGTQPFWVQVIDGIAIPLALMWLVVWSTYGILTDQLFDLDLKVKIGISRTTVAAVIAATAFIGSELIEFAFGVDQLGPALAIAAASTLAFRPLMRLGNRIADTALPEVEDTEEYRTVRKLEVYQAALESAVTDGHLTEKEQDVLATLAEKLGLTGKEVRRIESSVLAPTHTQA